MSNLAHNRTRYLAGCRCDQCKQAESVYQKARRRGCSGRMAPALTSLAAPKSQPAVSGRVVPAVEAELDMVGAVEARPGLAAVAVALAEIMDNAQAVPQKPAAAAQLARILNMLGKRANRGGRLAAVRTMTSGAAAPTV